MSDENKIVIRFWNVPALGWIDRAGWDMEKVSWNKARPVHGTYCLSNVLTRIWPWEKVVVIPVRQRTRVEYEDANAANIENICPKCQQRVTMLHLIDNLWVCESCWDAAYRKRFKLPPRITPHAS